jgi:hypothetical protein
VGGGGVGLAAALVLLSGAPTNEPDDATRGSAVVAPVAPDDPAAPETPAPVDPGAPAEPPTGRTIADPEINELSGLAASRLHPGVVFGINDSGGLPVVYALDESGATAARLRLEAIEARDWEALAPGWDADGRPTLWIGGIGDNLGNQERVRLLQIYEPEVLADQSTAFREYWITYQDGPHNAEALLVHPRTGEITVVTKGSGEPGGLYRPQGPLSSTGTTVLDRVMDAPTGITDGAWELSPSGEPRLVLTDYWQLHRLAESGWVSALGPLQLQREALAWPWLPDAAANDTVLLGSEGVNSTILTAEVP